MSVNDQHALKLEAYSAWENATDLQFTGVSTRELGDGKALRCTFHYFDGTNEEDFTWEVLTVQACTEEEALEMLNS